MAWKIKRPQIPHKHALLALACLALVGCETAWQKTGGSEHQFNVDSAKCKALAKASAPMRAVPDSVTTTHHSGTVYGQSGYVGSYSGTSTTYNPDAIGAAFSNIGAASSQRDTYEACMYRMGYSKGTPIVQAAAPVTPTPVGPSIPKVVETATQSEKRKLDRNGDGMVFQSEWFVESDKGGMAAEIFSAYAETEARKHNLTGELGVTCMAGHDGTQTIVITFRQYAGSDIKKWDNVPYLINFRSTTRTTGEVQIGGAFNETLGAIINPIVISNQKGDRNGLRLVLDELQGNAETFVYVTKGGKTVAGYMFTQANASNAFREVLGQCPKAYP